jgi:microcystin degradation protein MlrC
MDDVLIIIVYNIVKPNYMRVALLGIVHESNTFVNEPTTLNKFEESRLLFDHEIILHYKNSFHELGGMINVLEMNEIEIVPILYAEATPGGKVTKDAFEFLLHEALSRVKQQLPFDGILVVPHGAAVCEAYDDMDGYWLSQLRAIIGPQIPIIGTLDPHANVSQLMIQSTDALVAYKTNPHIDQRTVGMEAATIIVDFLRGNIKPIQLFSSLPLVISIEQQYSEKDPYKYLLQLSAEICKMEGILSASIILGFPYADVYEMGASLIVISDGDKEIGQLAIGIFEDYISSNKNLFIGVKHDISSIIPKISSIEKPILLLDMGDNVGGGAPGNSIFLLDKLDEAGIHNIFICIYDPECVNSLMRVEIGSSVDIIFGINPETFQISTRRITLLWKGNGKFDELKPRHGGQIHFDMGNIAIVKTINQDIVMLTSLRIAPYSLEQLLAFNIDPTSFHVIIAKGVNAPIAAYAEICNNIFQVNTPGVTQADITKFVYKNRRSPLFPFETE